MNRHLPLLRLEFRAIEVRKPTAAVFVPGILALNDEAFAPLEWRVDKVRTAQTWLLTEADHRRWKDRLEEHDFVEERHSAGPPWWYSKYHHRTKEPLQGIAFLRRHREERGCSLDVRFMTKPAAPIPYRVFNVRWRDFYDGRRRPSDELLQDILPCEKHFAELVCWWQWRIPSTLVETACRTACRSLVCALKQSWVSGKSWLPEDLHEEYRFRWHLEQFQASVRNETLLRGTF